MSKLSTFVRRYGEEIGIVGNIILAVLPRLVPNRQDRDVITSEAQRLLEASRSIAASYRNIEQAIPSASEVADNLRPLLVQVVADLVEAELSRRLGVDPAVTLAIQNGALADHAAQVMEPGGGNPPKPSEEKKAPEKEADKNKAK